MLQRRRIYNSLLYSAILARRTLTSRWSPMSEKGGKTVSILLAHPSSSIYLISISGTGIHILHMGKTWEKLVFAV